jgi:hypothetical protein
MEAKIKAKELVEKMINTYDTTSDFVYNSTAKECALIAVDEILNLDDFSIEGREYWREVKQEIEKL